MFWHSHYWRYDWSVEGGALRLRLGWLFKERILLGDVAECLEVSGVDLSVVSGRWGALVQLGMPCGFPPLFGEIRSAVLIVRRDPLARGVLMGMPEAEIRNFREAMQREGIAVQKLNPVEVYRRPSLLQKWLGRWRETRPPE